jgi:hypothetical protein|tara:strand:+ start:2366 stop:2848 length:483 start_codon:yes stop_codon:yes gene_type:complete
MDFTKKTPRAEATISGETFSVPTPFIEGTVLTGNQASALNQVLVENVRNNFASRIKKAKETEGGVLPSQEELDAYVSTYEFGERRGSTGDPVQREALSIATELVKEAIKDAGKKVSDFDAKFIRSKAEETVAANPQITEQAQAVVAQRASIGKTEINLGS